jgi:hypothetical protein
MNTTRTGPARQAASGPSWLAAWSVTALLVAQPAPGLAQASAPPTGAASAPATASLAPTREQVQRRLTSTAALLGNSSGAKQVQASANPDALDQLTKARNLQQQAQTAFDGGDLEAANKLLHAAAKTMMEAVGLAAPEQITSRKERADFDQRLESTRTLLDAQRRIAAEKGAGNAELVRRIEALMAQALERAAAGQVAEGRKLLDQAYGASKAAIGNLRSGDTLVRSLNFATKEEEFRYEVDRNDTHRMLVQVLLADKRGSGQLDAMIAKALDESARLRQQADEQGRQRQFEAGIKTLEDATRELVKAIRAAGVYIPG